jgi:hypothetical protein
MITDAKYIQRDETPKSLFNPLSFTFKTKLRGEDNIEVEYEIPSLEIATFPAYLAERIQKDLITAIKNQRHLDIMTPDDENKLIAEVEVKL